MKFGYGKEYGDRAGWLSLALLVLACVSLVATLIVFPTLPDQIAMRFDSAGNVLRWGSRFEVFLLPVLNLVFSVAGYWSAGKQAGAQGGSHAVAQLTVQRYLRNGIVTSVILNLVDVYILFTAITGTGFAF